MHSIWFEAISCLRVIIFNSASLVGQKPRTFIGWILINKLLVRIFQFFYYKWQRCYGKYQWKARKALEPAMWLNNARTWMSYYGLGIVLVNKRTFPVSLHYNNPNRIFISNHSFATIKRSNVMRMQTSSKKMWLQTFCISGKLLETYRLERFLGVNTFLRCRQKLLGHKTHRSKHINSGEVTIIHKWKQYLWWALLKVIIFK